MNTVDEERLEDDSDGDGVDQEVADDEFDDDADADDSANIDDDFDESDGDEDGLDIDAVVELSAKEQSARSLEIRRAIEERREKRRIEDDIDYLDLDRDLDD